MQLTSILIPIKKKLTILNKKITLILITILPNVLTDKLVLGRTFKNLTLHE